MALKEATFFLSVVLAIETVAFVSYQRSFFATSCTGKFFVSFENHMCIWQVVRNYLSMWMFLACSRGSHQLINCLSAWGRDDSIFNPLFKRWYRSN